MGLTVYKRSDKLWSPELWDFYNPLENDTQATALIKHLELCVENWKRTQDGKEVTYWTARGKTVGIGDDVSFNRAIVKAAVSTEKYNGNFISISLGASGSVIV